MGFHKPGHKLANMQQKHSQAAINYGICSEVVETKGKPRKQYTTVFPWELCTEETIDTGHGGC